MTPVQTDLLDELDPDRDFPLPGDLDSHGPARIIAMCNQKGGVGKTTTSINLAAALAEYGRKVLIVDFDPQGAASAGVGINAMSLERTLYDEMLSAKPDITRIIHHTSTENLDIVPSNIELSAAEIQLINEVAREQSLLRVLRPVVNDYDIIIVDCQPSLGLLTINALTAAHGVMIPLEAEFFAMRGVALLIDQIERVQDRLNPQLSIDGVLLTMVDTRTLHAREVISTIRQQFGDRVFETQIPRTVRFPDATVAAEPITSYDPKSKGAQAYRRLARELISRGGAP
ncbi:Sporulation initiation inhibitor protein Soj [Trueperella bernardiae]|uniref:Sporulation initiation inhibitor protein Soj n=1 Tax=Trueperella bernardiae TaxID=59561 RepID=A0A0W1KMF5_9ACTO|nr:ParA family protein [Trueperella bernardiae]KTF05014.1 Sporulation initiation inhibitor protein Soj [Trueperella bernardiae]MDV6237951.1 ParA family protein [Trueperella bernardiae]OCW60921.1 chromosome partitioning protein [Trueperella bernardiae]